MSLSKQISGFMFLGVLFFSGLSQAWVYVPGAIGCADWYRAQRNTQTREFRATQNQFGDWMLICRGKNSKEVALTTGVPNIPDPAWAMLVERGPRAAGLRGENLGEGQCAWPDRAMTQQESNFITLNKLCNPYVERAAVSRPGTGPASFGVNIMHHPMMPFAYSDTVFGVFVRPENGAWKAVLDASRGQHYFELQR